MIIISMYLLIIMNIKSSMMCYCLFWLLLLCIFTPKHKQISYYWLKTVVMAKDITILYGIPIYKALYIMHDM